MQTLRDGWRLPWKLVFAWTILLSVGALATILIVASGVWRQALGLGIVVAIVIAVVWAIFEIGRRKS